MKGLFKESGNINTIKIDNVIFKLFENKIQNYWLTSKSSQVILN